MLDITLTTHERLEIARDFRANKVQYPNKNRIIFSNYQLVAVIPTVTKPYNIINNLYSLGYGKPIYTPNIGISMHSTLVCVDLSGDFVSCALNGKFEFTQEDLQYLDNYQKLRDMIL